ncbi:hypothetical protein FV228_00035 [Methylobacterium sp. WL18]|nr:hypothetical protein FV228_00035 [Methylobacterium sp. WL18]
MATVPPPSLSESGPFGGANSLEGSLADHLAFCASWLADERYVVEATFVLAEARRVQMEVLRGVADATGDRLGTLMDEPLAVRTL